MEENSLHLLYSKVENLSHIHYLSSVLQTLPWVLPYFTNKENETQKKKKKVLFKMIRPVRELAPKPWPEVISHSVP